MCLPITRNCIDQETVPEETVPQYRTSWPNREMCSLSWHATKYGESYTGEIGQSFVSFWLSSTLTLSYIVDSLLRKLCSPVSHGGRGASRHHWTTAMPWQGSGTPNLKLGDPCSAEHSSVSTSSTAFQTHHPVRSGGQVNSGQCSLYQGHLGECK